ncbi:hypothetical protein SUGI_0858200 [Cryptomeria japonica]|nr:hypothetical protein SUGI_0858200 [Cryptomeria japonica]
MMSIMGMKLVQQSNRLQMRAPTPLEVKGPTPDLFNESNHIPLLSPLLSPRMDCQGDRSDGDVLQETESEIAEIASTRGRSWVFCWESENKQMAAFKGVKFLL